MLTGAVASLSASASRTNSASDFCCCLEATASRRPSYATIEDIDITCGNSGSFSAPKRFLHVSAFNLLLRVQATRRKREAVPADCAQDDWTIHATEGFLLAANGAFSQPFWIAPAPAPR